MVSLLEWKVIALLIINVLGITQGFLMGINGTIFAYGQTGAGKTYSIMGADAQNP